jgi:hypothetical protein
MGSGSNLVKLALMPTNSVRTVGQKRCRDRRRWGALSLFFFNKLTYLLAAC